jgi:hypothetical protein
MYESDLVGSFLRTPRGPGRRAGPDRIALAMWLKRLFGRGENVSPSGRAPSRKETEQDREDRLEDFMDEQVRQRDEDESHTQDKPS